MTPEQLREEYILEEMLYSRYENIDEAEYDDCILCCESHDIENMKLVNHAWVCIRCIQDKRSENVSTYKMVLGAQKRLEERRMRIEAGVKELKNFKADLSLITDSFRPKVKV